MNSGFVNLVVRWLVLALGVALSAQVVPGISYADGPSLLVAAILLSFLNAVLKPLLMLFTLPFIVLTLGVGIWLINAGLFLLTSRLVSGFNVDGFVSALLGALIVSVTNLVMSRVLAPPRPPPGAAPPARRKPDDVIDV